MRNPLTKVNAKTWKGVVRCGWHGTINVTVKRELGGYYLYHGERFMGAAFDKMAEVKEWMARHA